MLRDTSLLYFYEVARSGSIRKAAERLHVSPSAISRMITKAEHQFQAELFERRSKGMNLTDAGRILAEQMQGVVMQLHDARNRIDELRGLRRGEVRVNCIEGIVQNVVPAAVHTFSTEHPLVAFRIDTGSTESIVAALRDDAVDLGIVFNLRRQPGIEVLHSISQPLQVLVAPDHPLTRRASVGLRDVVQYPLAMPDRAFGVREMFDRALDACDLECRTLVTTNSLALTRSMARTGAAVTMSPLFAAGWEVAAGQVVALPVRERRLLIGTASVCKRAGRRLSAAAAEFVAHVQRQFEALGPVSRAAAERGAGRPAGRPRRRS